MERLINEYKESCKKLEERIPQLEIELSTARDKKAFDLEKRIAMLKEEILDLKYVINYLILTYKN